MKKFAIAFALVTVATAAAHAGNPVEPIIEPEIIVEQASSSSGAGIIVPLLLLAIVAVVLL